MLERKYKRFNLDSNYMRIINDLVEIKLLIVGQDPYPSGAMSIPFCKKDWADLDDRRLAGYHILNSVNENFQIDRQLKDKYNKPQIYFEFLAEKGIVMLNASYYFLEKETPSRKSHFGFVYESLELNLPYLNKAQHILLCGNSYKMLNWVVNGLTSDVSVPHPSLQSKNKGSDKNKEQWERYWAKGALAKKYNISTEK